MTEETMNSFQLDSIIRKTVDSIENGKLRIFHIAEDARNEWKILEDKYDILKQQVKEVTEQTENLETLEKKARRTLMDVSKKFTQYSQHEIKEAYDNIRDIQVKLALKREQENQIISQRTELEVQMHRVKNTLEKSQYLVTHIATAMNYLSGTLVNVHQTLEDLEKKELLGVNIILAQEEERQRLAREIHDGPAQSLSNIVLKSEICDRLMGIDIDRARKEIRSLKELVRGSLREIRKIIYDLRPMSLDDLGLVPTLSRYTAEFKQETGTNVVLDLYPKGTKIESIIEVAIFRIVQEALSNIRKYAQASRVDIEIKIKNDVLRCSIEDNGLGFDVDQVLQTRGANAKKSGFGIYGMRRRVELLNGRFTIQSIPGKGSTIKIEIPLYQIDGEE